MALSEQGFQAHQLFRGLPGVSGLQCFSTRLQEALEPQVVAALLPVFSGPLSGERQSADRPNETADRRHGPGGRLRTPMSPVTADAQA